MITTGKALPLLSGRDLLVAVDDGLEVRAGPELGHRRLRHPDGRPGGRVTGRAGGPVLLLEYAEPGDRDLVALGHGELNRVEHRVHGLGRGLLVPQPAGDRIDQVTLVHVSLLRFPLTGGRADRAAVTATSDLPEIRRCSALAQSPERKNTACRAPDTQISSPASDFSAPDRLLAANSAGAPRSW